MELRIESVSKVYQGNVRGLDDVSLTIGPGAVGLLGPNGAGKSTLMRLIATISAPTSGRIYWDGVDIAAAPDGLRSILGYLPQDFGVYPNLNAEEFLRYIAAAKGLASKVARRRIDELLQLVNLTESRTRPLGGFSGGMRQRVGIAQALLNDPQLLIVDEPTAGLDPEERMRFRNLLTELSGERIVLLSTHIVSDVESTATSIAIISHGRLLFHGAPEELIRRTQGFVWGMVVSSEELNALKNAVVISSTSRRPEGVHVRLVGALPQKGNPEPLSPTLEDAYLHVVSQHRNSS